MQQNNKINQKQMETIISEIGFDLQEAVKRIALLEENLKEHIRQFDAHKEPIHFPKWMRHDKNNRHLEV